MSLLPTILAATELFPKPSAVPQVQANSDLVASVMKVIFTTAGIVAVLIITIAAFQYVLSQGDPQKTTKAKNTILYAVVGLIVAIAGYSIVAFVIGKVAG